MNSNAPRRDDSADSTVTRPRDEIVSLRERKKALTRRTIIDAAERLFEESGYDHVTVAEIADAANVSVKTLFVYFRSKEDLAVTDDWLQQQILSALHTRPPDETPVHVVERVLLDAVDHKGPDHDLEDYHRGFGDAAALKSRILRVWAELEDDVTAALVTADQRQVPLPSDRYLAIQLVGLVRLTTTPEVRDTATSRAKLKAVIRNEARYLTDARHAPTGAED